MIVRFVPILIVVLIAVSQAVADDPPSWLRQAAAVTPPTYAREVAGVVLLDEQNTTVSSDGRLVSTENYAVRLLTREGRNLAIARTFYLVSSGRVREIKAWIVRPDGSFREYEKKHVLDLIADPDDVYNEGRIKVIDASDDVDAGYVFGYTVVSEDTTLFFQDSWMFQERLPTLISRFTLNLPKGWTATGLTFNAPDVRPQVNGSSYTWEMRNLPYIPLEPMGPTVENLSPRIVVNYAPDNQVPGAYRSFANWTDVSRWASSLHDGQVVIDDNVAAKARELTANAATELDKIRAIAAFVQNLQYISIDIGVGHGNGYRPRPSTLVLSRGYGDCKDKANLMRAMLRVLKIEAYPVAIFSGDPHFVREQWPSPRQFNHCIIAVKVSDGTDGPTVIKHARLGRLLMFDATDPYTPVGDLPDQLQDSFGLIAAGDDGGLVRMPVTEPEADLLERQVDVTIDETGRLKGKITERALGQTSAALRREQREMSAADYRKRIEGWLTVGATGATLENLRPTDRFVDGTFGLDIEFSVPRYAQLMRDRLLIFKPVVVGRRDDVSFTDPKRTTPILTSAWAMRETAAFALPAGFVVDEMPDAIDLETAFGKYSTRYEVKGGKLLFTRTLVMKRSTQPADQYEAIRLFYSKIRDAEQAPVVLLRK